MKEFKKEINWFQRSKTGVFYIIIANLTLYIFHFTFLIENWIQIEIVVVLLLILLSLRRSSRIIYKILLDDEKKYLKIFYFQFLVCSYMEQVSYSEIHYKYKMKSYGIGNTMFALIFYNGKEYVAEMRVKGYFGWTKDEILEIKNTVANLSFE